jgi:hypothetical protein
MFLWNFGWLDDTILQYRRQNFIALLCESQVNCVWLHTLQTTLGCFVGYFVSLLLEGHMRGAWFCLFRLMLWHDYSLPSSSYIIIIHQQLIFVVGWCRHITSDPANSKCASCTWTWVHCLFWLWSLGLLQYYLARTNDSPDFSWNKFYCNNAVVRVLLRSYESIL